MPYTPKDRRPVNSTEVEKINLETKGDLTAAIFDLMLRYVDQRPVNFQNLDDAEAACRAAEKEFHERFKVLYEGYVREENGDFPLAEKLLTRIDDKFKTPKERKFLCTSEDFSYIGIGSIVTLIDEIKDGYFFKEGCLGYMYPKEDFEEIF